MNNQSAALSGIKLKYQDWSITTESIREFQEQMKILSDSWKNQLKFTTPSINVTAELSKQISSIISNFKAVSTVQQEEIAKFSATIAKTIGKMNLDISAYQSEFKAMTAKLSSVMNKPKVEWGITAAAYINATRPFMTALNGTDNEISAMLKSFSSLKFATTVKIDTDALQKLSESVTESEYDFDDIVINNDGTLAVAGGNVAVIELKEAFTESLNESGLFDTLRNLNETIKEQSHLLRQQNDRLTVQEEVINRLMQQVSKLKGTRLAWIMQNIVLSIIIGLMINNFASPILQPFTDVLVQQIKKMMKIATTETAIKPVELNNHRYVTTNKLKLWAGRRMKSHVITYIHQGEVVRVLEKRRNWTYVLFIEHDSGELIAGWTFSVLKGF